MLGEVGFMIGLKLDVLDLMIDFVKDVELGYSSILVVLEVEVVMCKMKVNKIKIVCIFCGVGCLFEVWMKDCYILKV